MQLSLYMYGSDGQHVIKSSVLISQSTWYHVAVISDTNSLNLYVNGNLTASSSGLNMNTFKTSNKQRLTLTIGYPVPGSTSDSLYSSMCHIDETQAPLNRSAIGIDDLLFYSRQLKLGEIQALSNDQSNPTQYFYN
jgi:hypothetical protein